MAHPFLRGTFKSLPLSSFDLIVLQAANLTSPRVQFWILQASSSALAVLKLSDFNHISLSAWWIICISHNHFYSSCELCSKLRIYQRQNLASLLPKVLKVNQSKFYVQRGKLFSHWSLRHLCRHYIQKVFAHIK